MRIAFDIRTLGFALLAPLLIAFAAQAADIPSPPSATAIASQDSPDPVTSTAKPATGLAAAENKIPDSVRDVMKHLDKPTDEVTLDDLNSARQAVAKIEILIELEKRLAELDKVRRERDGSNGSMGSMIPASALQPSYVAPPVVSSPPSFSSSSSMPMTASMDVVQISGGGGHYDAIIKSNGDEGKTVRVGDHLSDGSLVTAISPTEVVVEAGGTRHTLRIKNVDTVFGNSF